MNADDEEDEEEGEEAPAHRTRLTCGALCNRTGLLLIMTAYTVVGALLFRYLEGGTNQQYPSSPFANTLAVQRSRDDCLRELWLITGVGVAVKIYKIARRALHLHKIPAPPSCPYFWPLGNFVHVLTFSTPDAIFAMARQWATTYTPVYLTWLFGLMAINVYAPDDCEAILPHSVHNTKSLVYDVLHNWLGTGLLTSNGDKWQERRKILTPAFHFNILQRFLTIFHRVNAETVQLLLKRFDTELTPVIDVNVTQLTRETTLQSIVTTAMGISLSRDSPDGAQYYSNIHKMGKVLIYRLMRPWLLNPILYACTVMRWRELHYVRKLHAFSTRVIDGRRQKRRTNGGATIMLDLLLKAEQEGRIDGAGIREEVDTFMFEGHDTTSVALNFILMLIAGHPNVQDRLYHEICDVLGADSAHCPSFRQLQDLPYMDQVLKEALRLYPSVHFISRYLGEDVRLPSSGHFVPKGTLCHLHIFDLHRNATIFPDPERFDPDRFLPQHVTDRHPFAYLPFSAGPRNCIGQRFAMLEMKSLLCAILEQFRLEAIDTQQTIVLMSDVVLRTKNDIYVKFSKRHC